MEWIIERVSVAEEAVYLRKPPLGIGRKICVPGACDAYIEEGKLVILANTGFVWEVEPYSGSRRRVRATGLNAANTLAASPA